MAKRTPSTVDQVAELEQENAENAARIAELGEAERRANTGRAAVLGVIHERPNEWTREMLQRAAEIREEALGGIAALRSAGDQWRQFTREWRPLFDVLGCHADPDWAQPQNYPRDILEHIPPKLLEVPLPAPVMLALEFEEDPDRETFPTIEERRGAGK